MTGGQRRGIFDADEDHSLKTLRLPWGDAYDIGFQFGRWVATSRDGRPRTVDSGTPGDLSRAIRFDWAQEAAR